MFVVTYRKIFFALSAILLVISIWAMVHYGFNIGIDFKGGTITEISYQTGRPDQNQLKASVDKLGLGNYVIQPSGERSFVVKTKEF